MDSINIGVSILNRSNIPEIFQGARPSSVTNLSKVLEPGYIKGDNIAAVWRWRESGDYSIFPNLLIGSEENIIDALAWSSSFFKEVGSLSGLVRILLLDDLKNTLQCSDNCIALSFKQLGDVFSAIVGEIISRQDSGVTEESITQAAAFNTLTFAVVRAAIVAPHINKLTVASRWSTLFEESKDPKQRKITEAVLDRIDEIDIHNNRSQKDRDVYFKETLFELPGSSTRKRKSSAKDKTKNTQVFMSEDFWRDVSSMSSEALTRVIDEVVPNIIQSTSVNEYEKCEIIAKLVGHVSNKLDNQLELSRTFLEHMPLLGISIGRNMYRPHSGNILATNKGVGWKIVARLVEAHDIFSTPLCDSSWMDWSITGKRNIEKKPDQKIIEMFPGYNYFRRQAVASRANDDRRIDRDNLRTRSDIEALGRIQGALEHALGTLHSLRQDRR